MACIPCPGTKLITLEETRYAWSWPTKVSQAEINKVTTKLASDLGVDIQIKYSEAKCCDECNKSPSGLTATAAPVGSPYRPWWSLWTASVQEIKGTASITVICSPSS